LQVSALTRRRVILQFMVRFFLVLCLLLPATMVEAATFYHCLDETGNETLLSFPIDGQHCKPVKTNEDRETPAGIHQENISSQQRTTKITVKGNQIFIPVTLVYGGRDVDVNLLMDTGATATTIHSHVADQFYVNLSSAEKAKGQVVGGGVIEASVIPLDF